MPKKGKGKGKKSQPVEPEPPIQQSDSDAESEALGNIQPEDEVAATVAEGGDMDERQDVEEKIAQFFEDRPYFYDLSNELYKNKKRRDSELQDLASALGPKWDGKKPLNL